MRRGHVPERTCISCRTRRPKHELVRLVRTTDGLRIGEAGGRGFYLCRNVDCLVKATKAGRFKRFLGRPVNDLESAALMSEVSGQNDLDGACGQAVICCSCTGGDPSA